VTRLAIVFAGLFSFHIAGCSNPYDGTWLFMLDMGSEEYSGACAAGQNDDWQVSGTSHQLVDIYTYGDDGISVLFEEYLDGTYDGSGFTADYEYQVVWDDETDTTRIEVDATLDGGVLTGTVLEFEAEEDADGIWDCELKYSFTGERVVSDRNVYVGG